MRHRLCATGLGGFPLLARHDDAGGHSRLHLLGVGVGGGLEVRPVTCDRRVSLRSARWCVMVFPRHRRTFRRIRNGGRRGRCQRCDRTGDAVVLESINGTPRRYIDRRTRASMARCRQPGASAAGGGGVSHLLQAAAEHHHHEQHGKLGPGSISAAQADYVLAPPSRHVSGNYTNAVAAEAARRSPPWNRGGAQRAHGQAATPAPPGATSSETASRGQAQRALHSG